MAPELAFRLVVRDDGTAVVERFSAGVEKTASRTTRSVGRIARAFSRLGRGINRLPGAIFNIRNAVGVLVVTAGLRKLIQTFGAFEKQMNRVAAITGETVGPVFEQLEATARRLGETTQFTATQAADAMGFLAVAGFEANEILTALPRTLELAAAANIDLARAADITTNILTGVGIPFEELSAANDVLVKAFTSTNVNLSQLGESFKFVGPVAISAGLQFEEVTAAIGLLGNAGIQGSMAGTTLRGAIARLLDPSKEAATVMKRLGVNALDSAGNLRPLNEIIAQLEKSGARTADIMQIFGLRAGPGIAALVSQGSAELVKLTKELEDSGGVAARVAKTQIRGLSGALIRLKSAFEGATISVGDALAPAITKIAESLTTFAKNLSTAVTILTEVGAAMADASDSGFLEFIDDLIPSTETLINGFFLLGKVIISLQFAFQKAKQFGLSAVRFMNLVAAKLVDIFFEVQIGITKIFDAINVFVIKTLSALLVEVSAFIAKLSAAFRGTRIKPLQELSDQLLNVSVATVSASDSADKFAEGIRGAPTLIKAQAAATDFFAKRLEKLDVALVEVNGDIKETQKSFGRLVEGQRLALDRVKKLNDETKKQGEAMDAASGKASGLSKNTKALGGDAERAAKAFTVFGQAVDASTERALIAIMNIQSGLDSFSAGTQARGVQDLNTFFDNQDKRIAGIEDDAERQKATEKAKFNAITAITGAGLKTVLNLTDREGKAAFRINQAIAVASAVVNTAEGVTKALTLPFPFSIVAAGIIAGIGAAQIAGILAAKPGGGKAPSVSGGGGGGGGAAAAAAPIAAAAPPTAEQGAPQLQITINVPNGFIGNDAELASALGPVIEEAVRDNVDFGLQVSR